MSVSLIVLRLELADDADNIPDFKYKAPHFELPAEEKLSYAEAVEKPVKPSVSDLQKHRGRRQYRTLTIETFSTEEVIMEEQGLSFLQPDLTGECPEDDPQSHLASSPRSVSEDSQMSVSRGSTPCSADTGRDTPEPSNSQTQTEQSNSASPELSKDSTRKLSVKTKRLQSKAKSKDKGAATAAIVCDEGEDEDGACQGSRPSSGKGKGKGQTANIVRFFSGNPAVENTEGILHLYKHNQVTSLKDDAPRSEMICMLMVPASMSSQDLLHFVAPAEPWIEHIKIIGDGTPNQYMVLLKFKSQKYTDDFYKNFNDVQYNSLESDICHLAYVAKIETVKASEGASLPVSGLTELPVCPVCLERMDESVDGILTILCNHSFHGSCLAQWLDSSCPVCRYCQTPEPLPDHQCFLCDSNKNLWICLICGHIGCGRYEGGHAFIHFQETNHTYSMQIENNRVWDYAGDNYVHRLVQSKGDGKMVEVDERGNRVEEEKLDSVTLEYTYLLTSQLEAQRHHFEDQMKRVEKDALDTVEELEARSKKALEQCTKLEHQLSSSYKDRQGSDRKCSQLNTKLQKMVADLKEEKEMNKSLRQNQGDWQIKVQELEKHLHVKDKEVSDLQDQLRDVMFYLEAQQKLSTTTEVSQEEIQEAEVVVQDPQAGAGPSGKRGRKKGGR